MPTTGVLVVEAMCRGPLSPPMNSALRAIKRAQLREIDVAEFEHLVALALAPARAARRGDSIGGRPIRGPRAEDDAPAIVTERASAADERRERRLGPAPKRIAGAHVNDDDLMPCLHARRAQPRGNRASATASSAISAGWRDGSAAVPGQPASAVSSSH